MQIASGVASSQPSPRYRNYVLTMLVIVYVFNFLDRQIVTILAEPIRVDLGQSDTQIGLMSGLALRRPQGTASGVIR